MLHYCNHYISSVSFREAHRLPFTNKYQPSLEPITLRVLARKKNTHAATRLVPPSRFASDFYVTKSKNISSFPISIAARARGVVECKNSRSLAASAPSRL